MQVELPRDLRRALETLLAGVAETELARATRTLSDRYRSGQADGAPFIKSGSDVAAYAAYRLPATYAAAYAALSALSEVRPEWQPRSLLDLGAGLGSATWAATALWPGIERITALDADPLMIAAGRQLSSAAAHQALGASEWRTADLSQVTLQESFDLVVLAYALGEVDETTLDGVVERAWNSARDVLVLIEPGTPAGYRRIERACDFVRAHAGFALAPCPHDPPCRVPENDWIHFAVRLPRDRTHRLAKDATLNYEDEKFSYVALARSPLDRTYSRNLRHPQVRKGHIYLQLCTLDGPRTIVVSKRDGRRFSCARKAAWGDIFAWDE